MKFLRLAFLGAAFVQLAAAAKVINTIDSFQFTDATPYKCWNLDKFHGDTKLEFKVVAVEPKQELPVNITVKAKLQSWPSSKDQGPTITYPVLIRNITANDVSFHAWAREQGEYCVLLNKNKQYHGAFLLDLDILEEIEPIDVAEKSFYHGVTALIGALIIAGIVVKYHIRRLSDMPLVLRRFFVLLVLYCARHAILSVIPLPSIALSFGYATQEPLNYWDMYVTTATYLGSGYEKPGKVLPLGTVWVRRITLVTVVFGFLMTFPVFISSSIVTTSITVDGVAQDVFVYEKNDIVVNHPYLAVFAFGSFGLYGVLFFIFVVILPYLYGYIMYSRFAKSGQAVNANLMKRTLLYHGVGFAIVDFVSGYFEVSRFFMEYVPLVLLWWIWSCTSPAVVPKYKGDDTEAGQSKIA
ncbi:hypothetical protein Cantr_01802 [Candida viswanathii]|uniref:Uncharacterized protein n=1 Tax=Candida viswanathii TaxID=5486 RepID=A0A367YJR9_9ASCO|nr:hypothetical protein Cantr_01802 [Candida viswanathii]